MEPLKAGDVVQLKSGGPRMTIQSVGSFPALGMEQAAECVWFDSMIMNKQVFALEVLEAYSSDAEAYRSRRNSNWKTS